MAKTMYKGKEVETIDCTPTWAAVAKVYIAVLQNPKASDEGVQSASKEIHRMAELADKFVVWQDALMNEMKVISNTMKRKQKGTAEYNALKEQCDYLNTIFNLNSK